MAIPLYRSIKTTKAYFRREGMGGSRMPFLNYIDFRALLPHVADDNRASKV
jgi:hypothetical protein